jgi:tetratricopeptide (TPR) repeat protein
MTDVLLCQRKFDEAYHRAHELLEVRSRVLGPQHPDTVKTKGILAESLQGLGRMSEARPFWDEAVTELRQILGSKHPELARYISGLSLNLISSADSNPDEQQRAIDLANEAVNLRPKSADLWQGLGAAYARSAEWHASLNALQKAVELGFRGELIPAPVLQQLTEGGHKGEPYQQLTTFLKEH